MNLPKISIVTPSYNQGIFLEQTIDSVLSQAYSKLEYIIIDGGSSDNSVEIIKKYKKYLHFWVSEPDRGQSDAINKGISHATGEIFNWLNSDDFLEPGSLQLIGSHFSSNPQDNIFAGNCRLFGNGLPSKIRRLGIRKYPEDSILNFEMNQPSSFYRLQIIKEFGGVTSSLHYAMDLELWFRYLAKYGHRGIHFSDYLISNFRLHENSKTESCNEGFINDERQLFFQIGKDLKLPEVVLNAIQPEESYYVTNTYWKCNALDKSRYYALLSNKYLGAIYNNNQRRAAQLMLLKLIVSKRFRINRQLLGLIYNLFFKFWK